MITHSAVAAVSDRRRRSEIDATIYVALYRTAEWCVVRTAPRSLLAGGGSNPSRG
jgi:hypothetical protein